MSVSQNNLSLVLNQQDASGVNIVNRSIGAISYNGVAGKFDAITLAADTNIHAFDLPCANVLQFYFKNTHATAVILLTMTYQGGAFVAVVKVQPGAVFCNWCASTSATAGFTAISYTSDTASATVEMFLGG
jgi:hypothetical protein